PVASLTAWRSISMAPWRSSWRRGPGNGDGTACVGSGQEQGDRVGLAGAHHAELDAHAVGLGPADDGVDDGAAPDPGQGEVEAQGGAVGEGGGCLYEHAPQADVAAVGLDEGAIAHLVGDLGHQDLA